jgi:hypothetical protein
MFIINVDYYQSVINRPKDCAAETLRHFSLCWFKAVKVAILIADSSLYDNKFGSSVSLLKALLVLQILLVLVTSSFMSHELVGANLTTHESSKPVKLSYTEALSNAGVDLTSIAAKAEAARILALDCKVDVQVHGQKSSKCTKAVNLMGEIFSKGKVLANVTQHYNKSDFTTIELNSLKTITYSTENATEYLETANILLKSR